MAKKKTKSHVSEAKKKEIKSLISNMNNNKTLMVVSVKGLPSRQFQDIKKKIRDKAKIKISKKSLLRMALEESGVVGVKPLEEHVNENCALLYSNYDAFEISGILAREKSPQKAKAGQIAPEDIIVKAGPTSLIPGPDISALSAAGLAPKVEGGKISVMKDKVIVKKDEVISEKMASIMAKLGIIPFEVGIEPIAAFMNGKVYADIKVDIEGVMKELEEKFCRARAFAVDMGFVTNETLDLIIGRAGLHEKAILALIKGESN